MTNKDTLHKIWAENGEDKPKIEILQKTETQVIDSEALN